MATLDPNRLLQDELKFELQIRGVTPTGTVEELRKTLRDLLRIEKLGKSFKLCTSQLDFADESKICEQKLTEVLAGVASFDGGETQWRKWSSRIIHLLTRIELLESPDDEGDALRSSLVQKTSRAFATLAEQRDAKARVEEVTLETLDPVRTSTPVTPIQNPPVVASNLGPVTMVPNVSNPGSSNVPAIPIHKWGLKFSGEVQQVSLNSFLEQVEDLRLSRGVTTDQLYNAASELFEGKAKIWYRAVRRSVSSWHELVSELKQEFQPTDYAERLWEEIKSRRQGQQESIGMYLAHMSNLFARLSITVPDETRMKILRKNLLPYFQNQLALTDIPSEQQLLQLCRRLEVNKAHVAEISNPQRPSHRLEPDLSYAEPKRPSSGVNAVTGSLSQRSECWNCRKSGHLAKFCRSPRTKHCYGCGAPDVIKSQCPKCSGATPRSGKVREGPSRADN